MRTRRSREEDLTMRINMLLICAAWLTTMAGQSWADDRDAVIGYWASDGSIFQVYGLPES